MTERTPVPVEEIDAEALSDLLESGVGLILDFESDDLRGGEATA